MSMGVKTGIGISTKDDLVEASREAALGAKAACPEPVVVLLFVTHNYPVAELRSASQALSALFPAGIPVAGGTVNGLTYGEARYDALFANKRAVAVVALGGAGLGVGVGLVPSPLDGPVAAGRSLAQQVQEKLGGRASGGILLGTGMASGFTPADQGLLDGIRAVNPRLRLTGTGLSGGMHETGMVEPGHAFLGDRVEKLGCLLIAFNGSVNLGFATANGMQPVGPGGFVTDAEGLIIKSIDGRPARDAIVDLLVGGTDANTRALFAKNPMVMSIERGVTLATADPEGDFYWCHMPAMFTPEGGALDYFGARKGTALSVVKIDPQSCMQAIGQAAVMLKEDAASDEFEAVIAFSCSLRGFTLGADVAHEDNELRRHVKARHQLGIVANGEIGCYRHGRPFYTGWVYALFGLADE
jgi:small ligand-binding sensory domain FIST